MYMCVVHILGFCEIPCKCLSNSCARSTLYFWLWMTHLLPNDKMMIPDETATERKPDCLNMLKWCSFQRVAQAKMGGILLFLHHVGETYIAMFVPNLKGNYPILMFQTGCRKKQEKLTLFFWKAASSELLRMRFENQAYLLKQMEEKDSRKNEAPGVRVLGMFGRFPAISGTRWFSLPLFLGIAACDVQNHGPKNVCQDAIGCSQCTNPSFPGRFLKEKNQHTERCSFFRQEKYLQQIQAAILERDAEAQRVDCMRVTGKMARAWGLGADHLFFVYL